MADLSALYPQPPQAQNQSTNLLSDPARAIGLLTGIQDLRLKQSQFNALSQQPAAALEGQNISNATAEMAQQEAASKAVSRIMGGYLAGIPKPSHDDVRSAAAFAARSLPNVAQKYPDVITAASETGRKNPGLLINSGLSPEAQSGEVTGTPTEGGADTRLKVPASNMGQGRVTGLAPGESELSGSPAKRAEALQATATTSPQYHADLENLRTDSKILDNLGGPTFEVEKKLNQLTARIGGFGVTMTPDQLKAGESFDKIVNGISLRQGQMFGNTDAGRSMTLGATPNTSMSKFGREGMIDMAQGNQDAVDAARRAWLQARANGATVKDHDLFMDRIGQEMDPRVFQFNRLSRDNQQKFLSQMDRSEIGEFEEKYKSAVARKWVKPLKAADAK